MAKKDDGKELDAAKDTGWKVRDGGFGPPPPNYEDWYDDGVRMSSRRHDYRIVTNGHVYRVQMRRWWFFWETVEVESSAEGAERWIAEQIRRASRDAGPWRQIQGDR